MVVISFCAANQWVQCSEYSFYSLTPNTGFELLTYLVEEGWQLLRVRYGCMENGQLTWVYLPVEAFDGQPIQGPLTSLQEEWEDLLR